MRTLLLALILTVTFVGAGMAAPADTLILAKAIDANSLDPAESQTFDTQINVDFLFEGLVRYDGNSLNIVPALAESWELSDDGTVWTFKLRPNVKFHDGTPLNAEAVVFSMERQRDTTHPYYNKFFSRWPAKLSFITKVEAVDDMTVKIHLKEPSPALLANLAFYTGYIVSPTAVKADKEGFRTNPVGTGYYKFVRWVKDEYVEYEANPDYWRGPPKTKRMIMRVIPDNQVRLLALEKGDIHAAYYVDISAYDYVKEQKDLDLKTAISLGIMCMDINSKEAPWNDVRVRRAIIHAIDRQRLFNTVFSGYGEFANQILPSHWFGHNPDAKSLPYDPEKAKQLLAEAGHAGGLKAKLIAWNGPRPYCPSPRDFATLVKADLAKVGIDVEIEIMNWATFREARDKNQFDFTLGGYVSTTMDPDGLIYHLYHSSNDRSVDRGNRSGYRNAENDKALDAARSTYDEKERDRLYKQSIALIDRDAQSVFVAHPMNALAVRKNLKNIFIHDSGWVPLWDVYLEQ